MKKTNNKTLFSGVGFLTAFLIWTILTKNIDLKEIGPQGTTVGFATLNNFIHNLTGVNMRLYEITDTLGLIPLGFMLCFAMVGIVQFIKRKSVLKVDFSILILGGFYFIVLALFLLFEVLVVNYRPILIDGVLEASYPSSTTLLVMSIMPTTAMQINNRIKNHIIKRSIACLTAVFTVFMVVLRLISGVHWFSDIVGGAFLSAGLVIIYYYITE